MGSQRNPISANTAYGLDSKENTGPAAPTTTVITSRTKRKRTSPQVIPSSVNNSPELSYDLPASKIRTASPEIGSEQQLAQRLSNNMATSADTTKSIEYSESDCETDGETDASLNSFHAARAQDAIDAKEFDVAEKHLKRLINSKSLSAVEKRRAQLSMAIVKSKLGHNDEAIDILNGGGFKMAEKGNVTLCIAENLFEKKQYEECLKILSDIDRTKDSNGNKNTTQHLGDLYLLRARVLGELKMYEYAKTSCKKAIKAYREESESKEKLSDGMRLMADILEACGDEDADGYRAMAKDQPDVQAAVNFGDAAKAMIESLNNLGQNGEGSVHGVNKELKLNMADTETMLAEYGLSVNAEGGIPGRGDDIKDLLLDIIKSRNIPRLEAFTKLWPLETPIPGSDAKRLIHYAAIYGNWPAINYLANLGTSLNAVDKDGFTPLHNAAEEGNELATLALLDRGANPNLPSNKGHRPLHLAILNFAPSTADVLLRKDADIDTADKAGTTALHIAALKYEDDSAARLLLEWGADVNMRDSKGYTVLHQVVLQSGAKVQQKLNLIKLFLGAGADVTVVDNEGNTPEMLAKEKTVKKLLAEEAKA